MGQLIGSHGVILEVKEGLSMPLAAEIIVITMARPKVEKTDKGNEGEKDLLC